MVYANFRLDLPTTAHMTAATAFRIGISCFMGLLIFVAGSGWWWTGSHQPAAQAAASRTVLAVCILAGLAGLAAIWRPTR
jgi:hypothetical protein